MLVVSVVAYVILNATLAIAVVTNIHSARTLHAAMAAVYMVTIGFDAVLLVSLHSFMIKRVRPRRRATEEVVTAQLPLFTQGAINPSRPAQDQFCERDNVGTRYETQESVNNFWLPYVLGSPKFPFIFFDMREKKDAMDAMLSLPPIKIASDSGRLISTEILQFGVYPILANGEISSWGFFLAGDQISPALYQAAIASCKRHNGANPRLSEPPKAPATAISTPSKPDSSIIVFDWEEKVDMFKQMQVRGMRIVGLDAIPQQIATKRHYKGPTKDAALAFLRVKRVDEPFYYLIVHTPEGVFGRDKDGIYEQPD